MSNVNSPRLKVKDAFERMKAEFGPINSVDELCGFLVGRINANLSNSSRARSNTNQDTKLLYLKYDGRYNPNVSNSHCSPIGKPTNWGSRDPKLPTSNPGFHGRIWAIFSHSPSGFGSDYMYLSGLNSGTGGYGLYHEFFKISSNYSEADNAFMRYALLYRGARQQIATKSDASMQFYPDSVRSLRSMYPLSWDGRLYIEDFDDLFGKLHTQSAILGESIPKLVFSWAAPEFITITRDLVDNHDLLFSKKLPNNRNFHLDDDPIV